MEGIDTTVDFEFLHDPRNITDLEQENIDLKE